MSHREGGRGGEERKPKLAVVVELCSERQGMERVGQGGLAVAAPTGLKM